MTSFKERMKAPRRLRRRAWLTWTSVRAVGELQILTRVSYVALFAVPIIAWAWPLIDLSINGTLNAVVQSQMMISSATEGLENISHQVSERPVESEINLNLQSLKIQILTDLPVSKSKQERVESSLSDASTGLEQLNAQLKALADKISSHAGKPLPQTWGFAFFAALAVAAAHFIYQSQAPNMVKKYSIDEYVRLAKEDFLKNPTERELFQALAASPIFTSLNPEEYEPINDERLDLEQSTWQEIVKSLRGKGDQVDEGLLKGRVAEIGNAAAAEYMAVSRRRQLWLWIAVLAYGIGLLFVIWISLVQSLYVGDAVGWW